MISSFYELREQILAESEFPPQQYPTVIQFPINDICNSKCQMCNIWQRKRDVEITPDEVHRFLNDPVFAKVVAVGINGGEPTLRADIGDLTQALIDALPSLQTLYLITNAVSDRQVIRGIGEIGGRCQGKNVDLDVMVSLDGIGEVHDRVRGRKGNFESAIRVIDFVKKSPFVTSHRIGCTVIKENVYDCENVLDWCQSNDIYARFRIGIPHRRLYSLDFPHPDSLDDDQKFHFANFLDNLRISYERNQSRRDFYLSLRDQLIYQAKRKSGCAWKSQGVTLSPRGELAYCAVESPSLGSLHEHSGSALYWNNASILKTIQKDKCASCLHDYEGTMRTGSIKYRFVKVIAERMMVRSFGWVKPLLPGSLGRLAQTLHHSIAHPRPKRNLGPEEIRRIRAIETSPSELPRRVLLCGWYGTETLGDKAILGGISERIQSIGNLEVELASLEPYVSAHTLRQMPELGISQNLAVAEAKQRVTAGKYCAIVFAGGPLMSSIEELKVMRDLFASIRRIGGLAIIAGCGIGPLGDASGDQSIQELIQLSTSCCFRDAASATEARRLAELHETPKHAIDPAFLWLEQHFEASREQIRKQDQILLALRDWNIDEYAGGMERDTAVALKESFEIQIRELVGWLTTHSPETKIVPFCMHKYAIGGNDREFYRRVLGEFPDAIANLDHRHRSPIDDFQLFLESRAVLAMRFHSVVFSLAARVPFRAIDYTRGGKIQGLLTDLELHSHVASFERFDGQREAKILLSCSADAVGWESDLNDQLAQCKSIVDRTLAPLGTLNH